MVRFFINQYILNFKRIFKLDFFKLGSVCFENKAEPEPQPGLGSLLINGSKGHLMRLSPKLPRSVQINKGGNFYGSPLNHYRQSGCSFLLNFYSMRIEWVNQVIVVAKIFGSSLILKLLNGHVILYKPIARQKNNSQILTVQSKNKTTGKHLACKIFFQEKEFSKLALFNQFTMG